MMTRRWLIKALVGLPFVGGLFRPRLDVVDVVKGVAPAPVEFNIYDAVISIELDPDRSPDEFTTLATIVGTHGRPFPT